MNWSRVIRQAHRWLGLVFTTTVIANIVVLAASRGGMPPPWVTYSPLLPLILLMFSGVYLFVLPYAAGRRGA